MTAASTGPAPQGPVFENRAEGAHALAEALATATPPDVVLAIARGGVVAGVRVAALWDCRLALLQVARLTAPPPLELVFGAVDEEGRSLIDYGLVTWLRLRAEEVESARREAQRELERRRALHGRPLDGPAASVLIVDDALIGGLSMEAAVAFARRVGAEIVQVAAPCASERAATRFRGVVDRFVCPRILEELPCLAAAYRDCEPVSDRDVSELLSPR
jgi:putative phosphoribosyl transferase